jgi:hypothetical protein
VPLVVLESSVNQISPPFCQVKTRLSIHFYQGIWLWRVYHRHVSVSFYQTPSVAEVLFFMSWIMYACPKPMDLGFHWSLQRSLKFPALASASTCRWGGGSPRRTSITAVTSQVTDRLEVTSDLAVVIYSCLALSVAGGYPRYKVIRFTWRLSISN